MAMDTPDPLRHGVIDFHQEPRPDIRNPSPDLYNEDLAPAKERNWGAFSIFNVWTSDVHSLWGYYLAASLFLLCGSFVNFVVAIGLGSLVIFALMNLIGYAGEKTGVPYPVLARASFGVWGANLPALVRAVVACFLYGAQTAAASGAIVALLTRTDSIMAFHKSTHFLGHSGLEVICFVVVWALQLLIIQNGMETVRKFQTGPGPRFGSRCWCSRSASASRPAASRSTTASRRRCCWRRPKTRVSPAHPARSGR